MIKYYLYKSYFSCLQLKHVAISSTYKTHQYSIIVW